MSTYVCPKCGFKTEQMSGVEVTHPCPKATPYKKAITLKEKKDA